MAAILQVESLKPWLRDSASRNGFQLFGIAPIKPPERDVDRYSWWLNQGLHGEMQYMERQQRKDVRELLPSVRSVICLGMIYNTSYPKSVECGDPDRGWISRYAWGDDYHDTLKKRMTRLLDELRERIAEPFDARIFVDTGPVLERAFSQAAGLGWIGKNSCLIDQKAGSWFLLGEILTSLEIEPDQPVPDRCGSCRRCIDACPTQAITAPGVLDATRCISYFTIESRTATPEEFRPAIGNHVFGCDICQDVCPWNRKAPITDVLEFQPRNFEHAEAASFATAFNPQLDWLASFTSEEFSKQWKNSPVKRAKYNGMLRNVATAMGNSGNRDFIPTLERLSAFPDPAVQEHANWAIRRLKTADNNR